MRGPRRLGSQRGISLVESLFATLVMAAGLIGLAQGLGLVMMMDSDSRSSISALNIAQSKLEELKSLATTRAKYDAMSSGTSNLSADGALITQTGVTATYTMSWTITSGTDAGGNVLYDSAGAPAYKTIQVTVTPARNNYGTSDRVVITTQVARPIS